MTVGIRYTYQDLLATPDDRNRHELFNGGLIMTPAPGRAHQFAVSNLHRILSVFVESHNLGKVLVALFDVYVDEETVVEPDILFVSQNRLHIIDEQKINGMPDVVIEVLSPSTEVQDRDFKFRCYAEEGVKEYWIVDPIKQSAEVYCGTGNKFALIGTFMGRDEVLSSYFRGLSFSVEQIWK